MEDQKSGKYQKSKGKDVNKLYQKLSNMSINTGLVLKTRLVWAKKKCIVASEISSILMQCSVRIFCERVIIFKALSLIFVS